MEIWDLYDENGNLTGKTHPRGQALPSWGYHLVVHVWIRNSRGAYLISQRAANRPTNPLKWECVGGHVVAGEDSLSAALRECQEEVGIRLDETQGHVVFRKTRGVVDGQRCNDIMDVWLFRHDGPADLLHATTGEVAQVKWATEAEIRAVYEAGELVPTLEYFFEKVV